MSALQFERSAENFRYYTKLLVEMRRDVDTAFKRVRFEKLQLFLITIPKVTSYNKIMRDVSIYNIYSMFKRGMWQVLTA